MSHRVGWLLLRRDGGLWAIRRSALRLLRSHRSGSGANGSATSSRIELLTGEMLQADELLALTARLVEHPFPRCARRYCEESIHGLSVWHEQPVILLATGVPPPACLGCNQETAENDVHGDEN
ncbi:MAG: hypothetical protein GY856_11340 [bacterium]|nr:hypothetical protein [bacterium]